LDPIIHNDLSSRQDTSSSGEVVSAEKKFEIQNLDAWSSLAEDTQQSGTTTVEKRDVEDKTWSTFQHRKIQKKRKELERAEKEEKLRREREIKDQERRKEEEKRKKDLEDEEKRKKKIAEEADMAVQKEREQARQAAKLAREKAAQNMNMNEQSMIMSFEQQRGDVNTPAILQMFHLKPAVENPDTNRAET